MCTLTGQPRWCLRGNVCVVSWRGSFSVLQAPCLPGPAGHWHCSSKKAICSYVGFLKLIPDLLKLQTQKLNFIR